MGHKMDEQTIRSCPQSERRLICGEDSLALRLHSSTIVLCQYELIEFGVVFSKSAFLVFQTITSGWDIAYCTSYSKTIVIGNPDIM